MTTKISNGVKQSLSLDSEIFSRMVEDIVTREELETRLKEKKQLRVKLGIDATGPDLHIGHAVNLWKIRALQEAGHKAVIILGDFTTQIGDPTGKSETRPILEPETIKKNIAALKAQVEQILLVAPRVYEMRKNSEWFGTMKTAEFLNLLTLVTHAHLIQRDMFQARIKERKEIAMSEMLYPILQGYDSVMIQSDLTVIGSDQLFNEHMGRTLQEKFGMRPQVIVTHKLLPGLAGGEKMSKSAGNYISLNDTSQDKFGKAMRVLDELIVPYAEAYTDMPTVEIQALKENLMQGMNPRDAKLFFAESLVARYHGARVATRERERFLATFSERKIPDDMPVVSVRKGGWKPVELLVAVGLAPSKSEARRLIAQHALTIDEKRIDQSDDHVEIKKGSVIRVGSRRFVKII